MGQKSVGVPTHAGGFLLIEILFLGSSLLSPAHGKGGAIPFLPPEKILGSSSSEQAKFGEGSGERKNFACSLVRRRRTEGGEGSEKKFAKQICQSQQKLNPF